MRHWVLIVSPKVHHLTWENRHLFFPLSDLSEKLGHLWGHFRPLNNISAVECLWRSWSDLATACRGAHTSGSLRGPNSRHRRCLPSGGTRYVPFCVGPS
jgi:hypothetical protein